MTYPDKDYDDSLRDALKLAQQAHAELLTQPGIPDDLALLFIMPIARLRLELHKTRQRAAVRKEIYTNG